MDEKIVEIINRKQAEQEEVIEDKSYEEKIADSTRKVGLIIDGQLIEFVEKTILEDRLKIYLPDFFEIMSAEMAALKYPSARRPELIYTNPDTTINLSFNHTATKLKTDITEEEMTEFKDYMLEVIQKMQPAAEILSEGVEEINGQQLGYLEFVTPALDTDIYNFNFLVELQGRALICSFNCIAEKMTDWKVAAKGMMQTVEIVSEEVKGGSLNG